MNLQERAKTFLDRKPPQEIDYVPNSIAELFIRNYVQANKFDDEFIELGELAMMTADEASNTHSTEDAQAYFSECKSILSEILAEQAPLQI